MRFAGAALFALGICACDGDNRSVIGPSPAGSSETPSPTSASATVRVQGAVTDSAFRPLAGVRVEVISGPDAGMTTQTDVAGQYALTGSFDETTEVRVSKDGHLTASRALGQRCSTCRNWAIYFHLEVPAPPVDLAGNYTVSFDADSACELPDSVRRRSYPATLSAVVNQYIPKNTLFEVALSDSTFLAEYSYFTVAVAGDYVAFNLGGTYEPFLVEQLEANTYLAIGGSASASVASSRSTISVALEGTIEYCKLRAPVGDAYLCSALSAIEQARCPSMNHRLTLAPR
jgi:hypothetical protein